MRGLRLFVGMVLGALASAALAQPSLPDVPSFCSATTAFGQIMGSTKVFGVVGGGLSISSFVEVSPEFTPFTEAEVVFGPRSKQINRVNAFMEADDAAAALRIAEEIRGQFRRAGWIEAGGKSATRQVFDPLGDDLPDFNSERGGLDRPPTGRRVQIEATRSQVMVTCIDLPGAMRHMNEVFGPPPVGEEKPTPPQLLPEGKPAALDCTKPLGETERQLRENSDQLMQWTDRYKGVNDYFEQLIEWNGQKFMKAGKWTEKQKKDFELSLLSRPELKGNWDYFMGVALKTFTRIGEVFGSSESKDDARACRALNGMYGDMAETWQRTLQHAAAIDKVYQAEAARLGVKLD